jgi:hypothetical protein
LAGKLIQSRDRLPGQLLRDQLADAHQRVSPPHYSAGGRITWSNKRRMDYQQITEALLRTIARDEKLIDQFAKAVGIEREEFEDYLDNVEFPVIGRKTE